MTNRRVAGSVRRRDSGRWQARIRDPLSGRLVGLGTFARKGDADRALALALADQTRGGWVDPARGRVTLAAYAYSWLEDRRLRPRTEEPCRGLWTVGSCHRRFKDLTDNRLRRRYTTDLTA